MQLLFCKLVTISLERPQVCHGEKVAIYVNGNKFLHTIFNVLSVLEAATSNTDNTVPKYLHFYNFFTKRAKYYLVDVSKTLGLGIKKARHL